MSNLPEKIYALSEHGHKNLPWPMPADTWLWQTGNQWVAHVGLWYAADWWDGADPADIAARPLHWCKHILDVPKSGTLIFNDVRGNEQRIVLTASTRADIKHRCSQEGLGIMADIFDIILDRGEVTEDQVMQFLDASEDRSVQTLYEEFIVGGINDLSDEITNEQGGSA